MKTKNSWYSRDARKFAKAQQLLTPCISEKGGLWADYGCGEGIYTATLYHLLGPTCEIYAVDKSQRALKRLARNFQETFPDALLHPLHTDFTAPHDLPPLDGFILANALHFIQDNLKRKALAALLNKLKPGGQLIIVEYNTNQANYAVPFPLPENAFLNLANQLNLQNPRIVVRAPSSFLGEMYAGSANTPHDYSLTDKGLVAKPT